MERWDGSMQYDEMLVYNSMKWLKDTLRK